MLIVEHGIEGEALSRWKIARCHSRIRKVLQLKSVPSPGKFEAPFISFVRSISSYYGSSQTQTMTWRNCVREVYNEVSQLRLRIYPAVVFFSLHLLFCLQISGDAGKQDLLTFTSNIQQFALRQHEHCRFHESAAFNLRFLHSATVAVHD